MITVTGYNLEHKQAKGLVSKEKGMLREVKREKLACCIHLIPKWRPINYSFVCMLNGPLCLIFTSKFFCILYMLTRQRGLINMQTKELFIGCHFGIRPIIFVVKGQIRDWS